MALATAPNGTGPAIAGLAAIPDTRSEAEVAFGVISCRFGDEPPRHMRTLKIGAVRVWKGELARAVGQTLAGFNVKGEGADSIGSLVELGMLGSDLVLELVLAYDVEGALGGREWLEAHADDRDLYRILRTCLGVHFPFVGDLMGILASPVIRTLMTAPTAPPAPDDQSDPASSSSGPSPIGTSDPTSSRRPSTKRS